MLDFELELVEFINAQNLLIYWFLSVGMMILLLSFQATSTWFKANQKFLRVTLVFMSLLMSYMLTSIFKIFFEIPRPFDLSLLIELRLTNILTNHSFPSGVAAYAGVGALWLSFYLPARLGVLAFISCFIFAFIRVWQGVHYPSDILVGFILGCSVAWFFKRYL